MAMRRVNQELVLFTTSGEAPISVTTLLKSPEPIAKTSLAESVYQRILEAILSGSLAGGMELSEVALAAELGVSRTPVHEALLRLAADGLVEDLVSRQARVARFTREDVVEIYDMRRVLEPAAAERAAGRLDREQLAELRSAAKSLLAGNGKRDWANRAIEFDLQFHQTLAAAAGNKRLQAEIAKYRRLVRAFCRATGDRDNLQQALREHLKILDALNARDGAAARQAMIAHIDARLRCVLERMQAEG
jgi:DNA-binding GntR family transcriptional regulator